METTWDFYFYDQKYKGGNNKENITQWFVLFHPNLIIVFKSLNLVSVFCNPMKEAIVNTLHIGDEILPTRSSRKPFVTVWRRHEKIKGIRYLFIRGSSIARILFFIEILEAVAQAIDHLSFT